MKPWQVVSAVTILLSCATAATEYDVRGSCAEGLPSGEYALVLPNGLSQVTGTFSRGKRDGVFTFLRSSGGTIAAIPYRMDQIDGTLKLWYGPESGIGQQKVEASYSGGSLNGTRVSWYPSGAKRSVCHYTEGKLDTVEAWDSDGGVLSPSDAAALAASDSDADRRYFDVLDGIIRENLPRCS